MIDINEAISLFQDGKDTYYSLWVFYYTASAGVLAYLYSGVNNSQLLKTLAGTVLYLIIVLGNSTAILSTQIILNETKQEIELTLKTIDVEPQKEHRKVNVVSIVPLLQITNYEKVERHYWSGTAIVFIAIWFPYFLNVRRHGFKSTIA